MTSSKVAVGLIGLGAMGSGMAKSLRNAGHNPSVFDVRADVARPLPKKAAWLAPVWPTLPRPATF